MRRRVVAAGLMALLASLPCLASSSSSIRTDDRVDAVAYAPVASLTGARVAMVATFDAAHVRVDRLESYGVAGAASHAPSPATSSTQSFGPGSWHGVPDGGHANLFVAAGPNALLRTSAQSLEAALSTLQCLPQPEFFVSGHSPLCPDVGGWLRSGLRPAGELVWQGDFTLGLWAWNLTVADAEGGSAIWTGQYPATDLPGPFVAGPVVAQKAEVRLTNATLTLAVDGPVEVYSPGLHLASPLAWEIADARGALHVAPGAAVALTPAPDGVSLEVRASRKAPEHRDWAWVAAGSAGLAAATGLALRLEGRRQLGHAARAMVRRDFGAASRHAAHAMRLPGARRGEAAVLRAVADLRGGRLDDAGRLLARLPRRWGPRPAAVAFLRASLAARQGKDGETRRHLADCLRLDGAYEEEARLDPYLHRFVARRGPKDGYA